MATDNYTKKTASLKASKIDVRKLNVGGKDISHHVGEKVHTCKDTRQTITENDLWGTYVEVTDKGDVIFHDDFITMRYEILDNTITRVENNKAYIGDDFYCNIQTQKIKNGFDGFCDKINLTSFSGNLDSLVNGDNMFVYCYRLQDFNCPSMKSLKNGGNMFFNTGIAYRDGTFDGPTTFNCQLPNLEMGDYMFCQSYALQTFSSKLPKIKNALSMFDNCYALVNFEITSLPQVLTTQYMLYGCEKLQKCTLEMPKVTNTQNMFECCLSLQDVKLDMPSVVSAQSMFSQCGNLEQYVGDLSSIKDGRNMFYECGNLKRFRGRLDNLICATYMFTNTKLDVDSFMYIADSINDLAGKGLVYLDERNGRWFPVNDDTEDQNYIGRITYDIYEFIKYGEYEHKKETEIIPTTRIGTITIYYDAEQYPDGSEGHAQILEYCQEICDKGWAIALNSSSVSGFVPSTNQTSIDGEETVTPVSYWFKPIESDEEHGTYVNANGEYFDIMGGRYIFGDDISTYGQFTSLEEAEQAMGLTKVVREKITKTKTRKINK